MELESIYVDLGETALKIKTLRQKKENLKILKKKKKNFQAEIVYHVQRTTT